MSDGDTASSTPDDCESPPFVLWIIGNFTGAPLGSGSAARPPITVTPKWGGVEELLSSVKPSIRLPLPAGVHADAADSQDVLELNFRSLADFGPDRVARRLAAAHGAVREGLTDAMNAVIHEHAFQTLHATWLGIGQLLDSCALMPSSQVVLVNAAWDDVVAPSSPLQAPSMSKALRRTLERLGTDSFGHNAPTAVLVDFAFGPRDVGALSELAALAKAAHSVVIGAARAEFFLVVGHGDQDGNVG
jgi:predicted component of type VI protein secretion system